MTSIRSRFFGLILLVSVLMLVTACGKPASTSAAEDGEPKKKEARKAKDAKDAKSEPGPPADFVRAKCTACSCRFFSGDEGYCSRPSCRHHWKDHQP